MTKWIPQILVGLVVALVGGYLLPYVVEVPYMIAIIFGGVVFILWPLPYLLRRAGAKVRLMLVGNLGNDVKQLERKLKAYNRRLSKLETHLYGQSRSTPSSSNVGPSEAGSNSEEHEQGE